MTAPIVFISRLRIRENQQVALASRSADVISLIRSTKPRTALFAAYANESRTEVRIVHVFPDTAAMTQHFEGSEERTQSVSAMIELAGFEVYGQAPHAAMEQLRREADSARATLTVFSDPLGGFLR